jgi:2,3-bisphosphoglycerate-dependent phosphoglycerate mutase
MNVNIPTGVPLIYKFNSDNKVLGKEYLIDKEILKAKQKLVKDQGKK